MNYIEYVNQRICTMNDTKVLRFPIERVVHNEEKKEWKREQLRFFDVIDFKEDNSNG